MTDRVLLCCIAIWVVGVGGWCVYDALKDRGVRCHVQRDILYCPPGTHWTWQALDQPTDLLAGNHH